MQAKVTLTVGMFFRTHVRNVLTKAAFDHGIQWSEAKSFLSSEFYLRGDEQVIRQLVKFLEQ